MADPKPELALARAAGLLDLGIARALAPQPTPSAGHQPDWAGCQYPLMQ